MPKLVEQQLEQTITRDPTVLPIIAEAELIAESTGTICDATRKERFSDRKLSRFIGALIAVRKQHNHTDQRLIKEISHRAASFNVNSPRKTNQALAEIVAELDETNCPINSVRRFINTIKHPKPENPTLKGGV